VAFSEAAQDIVAARCILLQFGEMGKMAARMALRGRSFLARPSRVPNKMRTRQGKNPGERVKFGTVKRVDENHVVLGRAVLKETIR
jgi:hypothetical protein